MPSKKALIFLPAAFLVASCFLTTAVPAFAASQEQIVYSFCPVSGCPDGAYPWFSGVTFDSIGNMYGTTSSGGAQGYGTVFELMPGSNGTWSETVLYSFCSVSGCADGAEPGGGVIVDGAGNLYGTTGGGGAYGSDCGGVGCGTVFELMPDANGIWTEKVLYSFSSKDGSDPFSPLVFDAAGNLYGTTPSGSNGGTAFELMPAKNGTWTAKVLHNFNNNGTDGYDPQGALIFDAAGNLYGTTVVGGTGNCGRNQTGCGTVFKLIRGKTGNWKEKVLHSFTWDDGADPNAGLVFDGEGNLYGTALKGGGHHNCFSSGCGTVFELMRGKKGSWKTKVLHAFKNDGIDGCKPYDQVIFDGAGNLYGTTAYGGPSGCTNTNPGAGTVFQLTPGANGKWTETVLYSFQNNGTDGQFPIAGLALGATGDLFGTTYVGGAHLTGTVFEIAAKRGAR